MSFRSSSEKKAMYFLISSSAIRDSVFFNCHTDVLSVIYRWLYTFCQMGPNRPHFVGYLYMIKFDGSLDRYMPAERTISIKFLR